MGDLYSRHEALRIVEYLFERPLFVTCDLCGGDRTRILARIDRHAIGIRTVICRVCGLIYTNPRPSEEALERFYQADYRVLMKEADLEPERHHEVGFEEGERLAALFAGHLKAGVRSVLEIGSAAGGILRAFAQRYDAEVLGVEPTLKLAKHANSRGLRTLVGLFETLTIPEKTFDLALMVRTVRHLFSPARTFAAVRRALVPGGRFLVECTDVRKYVARYSLRGGLQVDHLYAFTPETLGALLRVSGFRVAAAATHPSDSTRFVLLAETTELRHADQYPDARTIRKEILTAHRRARQRLYRFPDYVREVLGDQTVNRVKSRLRWNN